jgi:hypothetical protein
MIVAVTLLNIPVIALGLHEEKSTAGFFEVTIFCVFFFLNVQLWLSAFGSTILSTSSEVLSTLSFWLSMYILFLLSQCLILCIDPRAKYISLPITSKIAADYLVQSLGVDPSWQIDVELGLACSQFCVIHLSLIISVKLYEDSKACQPPSLPLRYKI